ncbi:MAG TPA: carboxypeptidase-like regulatory domain-containing protein [Chitinophagales bacterium]|nr:carboxypeptidase-like regulatory domain-containing protein [Chitinophagales bacterium]HAE13218.1 hypothetical protein [Bacteroidota bacterium]MCB9031589.1 carboxypeptidase-like regulatory domain-containing protein [Chitinophagales bacterium]HAE35194.1 hypothetical protein [Bacteroidota bacterium]HPE98235.1 carboxypeptidase-like regulatory domain-containing protein [Chitinophagales bacterium]
MKRFSFLVLLLLPLSLFAQDKRILQFSGLVMTSDSLRAIPLVNIYSKTSGTGTFTDWKGFFSLVAREGDTIIFSAIGFETAEAVIPDSLPEDRYSMVQLMTGDTIFLAETVIFPWPSREDFRETFLYADIPADQYEIAAKNLEREKLKELGEAYGYDADANQDYYTKQIARELYYAGQNPPIRIFDVFAWKAFIEAWQRGDFKNH